MPYKFIPGRPINSKLTYSKYMMPEAFRLELDDTIPGHCTLNEVLIFSVITIPRRYIDLDFHRMNMILIRQHL